jgi:hypothetical protein
MSKRLDRVLSFCTQHRYAPPMLTKVFAKLGHECWNTVRATGVFAAWRRVPITTVTITLVIGFWLYDYVSVSSAATASARRPSIAVESAAPVAVQPLAESQSVVAVNETPKKTHRTHHKKTSHSAFRRKSIGQDEVDYVANDVTIRLFTPDSAPAGVAHSTRQRHAGKDVAQKRGNGSGMTQAAERSALVSK